MLGKLLICLGLCFSQASAELLIRDVTVVDVSTGAASPGRSILIRGDRIVRIGTAVDAPKGSKFFDGRGRFVISGLWDMHVHLSRREYLPLYLAHGITGVRDMGGDFDQVRTWRDQVQSGRLIGPHIETCGSPVDGFPSDDPRLPVRVVRGPVEARAEYDRLDDEAVDFIAVRPRLPRDAYFALIERARKYFSPVAGAIPATVTALEAVDNRQRSIDHMSGILLACSKEEKKLRAPRALALERRDWSGLRDIEARALATFSTDKADVLFHRMAMFDTRSVPVLVTLLASGCGPDYYERLAQLALAMLRAGVGIMSGSDDGVDGAAPGDQLQQELELLVAAGFTPAEALRAATLEPARYLDAAESLGVVAQGKIADLLLLDRNPLSDIRSLRRIDVVIVGGRIFHPEQLQKLGLQD